MNTIAPAHRVSSDTESGDGGQAVDNRAESVWVEPPIPDDPREQRRIKHRLMALALAGPVARILSVLFR
jgi:hypothetical protein